MALLPDAAVSTHQSFPTAFGVKLAVNEVEVEGVGDDVVEVVAAAPSHGCDADDAVCPAASVARNTIGVPLSTCTLVAQLPHDLRVMGCQVPPFALKATFAGAAEEVTLTSCHHSFDPEATAKLAVNAVEVEVGEAAPYGTARSARTMPAPDQSSRPAGPTSCAVASRAVRTCWLDQVGCALHTRAATPATCGALRDVPPPMR